MIRRTVESSQSFAIKTGAYSSAPVSGEIFGIAVDGNTPSTVAVSESFSLSIQDESRAWTDVSTATGIALWSGQSRSAAVSGETFGIAVQDGSPSSAPAEEEFTIALLVDSAGGASSVSRAGIGIRIGL